MPKPDFDIAPYSRCPKCDGDISEHISTIVHTPCIRREIPDSYGDDRRACRLGVVEAKQLPGALRSFLQLHRPHRTRKSPAKKPVVSDRDFLDAMRRIGFDEGEAGDGKAVSA